MAPPDFNLALPSAVGFENVKVRQPLFIRNIRNRFAVRRPARMEVIMIPERQLVWLAAFDRQRIKVIELIRAARCRCIDEPLAIGGNVRPRLVEGLLLQDLPSASHRVPLDANSPQVTRTECNIPVRNHQQFASVTQPCRLSVNIPLAEVLSWPAEAILASERHLLAGPVAAVNCTNKEMKVTRSFRRYVREAVAIRRENRIGIDFIVLRQGVRFACLHVHGFELNRFPLIIGRVNDPFSVRRPGGRRMKPTTVRQFPGLSVSRVDFPDGAMHRDCNPLPVGGPCRPPRCCGRRMGKIVARQVIAAKFHRWILGSLAKGIGRHQQPSESVLHQSQAACLKN